MNEETENENRPAPLVEDIAADPGANAIAEAIAAAEDVHDPLDGLIEKCAADPGAAFTPEVLDRLACLKKEDRAAFESLRPHLA